MIVVSHRGPSSFTSDGHGGFTVKRGAGGVVSAFSPILDGDVDGTWIAAAISDDDVAAAHADVVRDLVDADVRLLALDPELHRLHYDVASNEVLWFLFHDLFGLGRDPTFDRARHDALDAYRAVNDAFADAACEAAADGDVVIVNDYQLALVPAAVRERRSDLRVVHFTHTPFCAPDRFGVLPEAFGCDLLRSLCGGPAGFHTARWRAEFAACVASWLGDDATDAFVAPLGPDGGALRTDAQAPEVGRELDALDEVVGDRTVVLRVDRIEPSKNLIRGFEAFGALLERAPELHGRVVFVAMLYPSRQSLPLYREYAQDVHAAVGRVNERFATAGWTPVVVDERDFFARTLAGYRRADVVFVNPVRDGLNLVAKEAPLVNERDAALCLSTGAGAYDELAGAAIALHPFDVEQQAGALHAAVTMPADERAARARLLRETAAATTPARWLSALVARAQPPSAR